MSKRICLCCIGLLLALVGTVSCSTGAPRKGPPYGVVKQGPPPHAPAHGYRRKQAYRYRYYPTAGVYFDLDRKVYFFLANGEWRMKAHLPGSVHISVGEAVELSLETDTPYVHFQKHKAKYPPGQRKKHKPGARGHAK